MYVCMYHGVSWTLICGGVSRSKARIVVRGDIKQNFIHEFLSHFVLQWLRQNFGSKEAFNKNVLIKDFFEKFQRIYENFSKIKCNKKF